MKGKTAAIIFSIIPLLFLVSCNQQDQPGTPGTSKPGTSVPDQPGTSGQQGVGLYSYIECLARNGVKMKSACDCGPCLRNVEGIFNTISAAKRPSEDEFKSAFSYFKRYVYVNCTPGCEIAYSIKQEKGIWKLGYASPADYYKKSEEACPDTVKYTNTGAKIFSHPLWVSRSSEPHSGAISIYDLGEILNISCGTPWK